MKILVLTLALLAPTVLQESRPAAKVTPPKEASVADADVVKQQLPSYPLKTCAVSGEPLGSMGDPINHVVDGRLVRLCCGGCTKGVAKNKEAIFGKLDKAVVRAQGPSYPLDVCAVSGEKLEKDGTHDQVVGTRLVRTCCKMCGKKVAKEPRKYLDKVNAALIETQLKSYPVETCLVSGEALGKEPVNHLYGTQLVRLCCKSCVRVFEKSPDTFLVDLKPAKK